MADVDLDELARARAGTHDQVLSIKAVAAALRTFCGAAGAAFAVTAGIGAVSPTWGLAIAAAMQRLYLAPGHYLSQYLSAQAVIAVANSMAALGASVLGACGALLVARIQQADAGTGRTYGLLGRASYVAVSWLCSAARRCAPQLATARDMDAQTAAAVAVLAPRLSITCSGCALGIYLAGSLLTGWTGHLLRDAIGLLPHGVCEVPAIIASAAVGICISESLVAAAPHGLQCVYDRAKRVIISPRLGRVLGIIVAAIVIGAAIEARTM